MKVIKETMKSYWNKTWAPIPPPPHAWSWSPNGNGKATLAVEYDLHRCAFRENANKQGASTLKLLMLSIEPSLWAQGGLSQNVGETTKHKYEDKGRSSVLNANATKFKVLSHASERDERSEARAGTRGLSRVGSL